MGTAMPALGSNGATSRLFGTAAGADYWFSAHTLAGFALVGGGTNFSVVNGGTGRSDLFQAGAFVRHHNGPASLSGALTTASVELKWRNGFSVGATFEGEFSNVTRSDAGKGVVRHAW